MPVASTNVEQVRVRVLPDGRMTREDAAGYLGMRPKTLAMWVLEGKGPPARRVMGRIFYFKDDLDALIRGEPDPSKSDSDDTEDEDDTEPEPPDTDPDTLPEAA